MSAAAEGRITGSAPGTERLLSAVVGLAADLSLPEILQRVARAAATVADARYCALGVLGPEGDVSDFVSVGLDEETVGAIGHVPEGRGILGLLVADPRPLRLRDLAAHPAAHGFPAHHPEMRTFLGVPIRVGESVFGNLYLCEKRAGREFTEEDEALVVALAAVAGAAVENVRLKDRLREVAVLEERERIARDLHDTVVQRLFATGMALRSASRVVERVDVAARIEQAIGELDDTIAEIRDTILALHTGAERRLRLRLVEVIDESVAQLGFRPKLHVDEPVDRAVRPSVGDHAVAVVREALSNAARHARARSVEVGVTVGADLVVRVSDDGVGIEAGSMREGHGLANLAERARGLGGTFGVGPGATGGTVVEWRVPL